MLLSQSHICSEQNQQTTSEAAEALEMSDHNKNTKPFVSGCVAAWWAMIPTSNVSRLVLPGQWAIFLSTCWSLVSWEFHANPPLGLDMRWSPQKSWNGAHTTTTPNKCTWWSCIVRSVLVVIMLKGSQCCSLNPAIVLIVAELANNVWGLRSSWFLKPLKAPKHLSQACVCPIGTSSSQAMYQGQYYQVKLHCGQSSSQHVGP